jgi:hypothetical protein
LAVTFIENTTNMKKNSIFVKLFAGALIISSLTSCKVDDVVEKLTTPMLVVTVVDANNNPVSNANVNLYTDHEEYVNSSADYTATTDNKGKATFITIVPEDYLLSASKDGKQSIFKGFVEDGVFMSQAEVDESGQQGAVVGGPKYKDINGDRIINNDDQTHLFIAEVLVNFTATETVLIK